VITTTPTSFHLTTETSAERLASARWASNLDALAASQPRLAETLRAQSIHVSEWIFARDGSLTAFTGPGRWWTGCSLPHRAASAMLKSLQVAGTVACLLDPPHAAHVRVTLDKLPRNQAVVALTPDLPQLALLLHCEDFADDAAAHRLYFAWGDEWAAEMARVFEENPGLPTPSTFVRLPIHDDAVIEKLVARAQDVFTAEGTRRTELSRARRGRAVPAASESLPFAAVAPSHFRLWEGAAAYALAAAMPEGTRLLDPDDPAAASPLALAAIAEGCRAIVTADIGRGDAPSPLPDALPWVTWVTTPRIPAHNAAAPKDVLLLADESLRPLALAIGWPSARLGIAGWPAPSVVAPPPAAPDAAIIADTQPLDPPKAVDDYSSHRLLWEQIAAELGENPFAAIDNAEAYLAERQRRANIEDAAFDRRLFLAELIAPAVAQGLARVLLAARVPLRLYGTGWAELDAFAHAAAGAVASGAALADAVNAATLLIDPRPAGGLHAMHAAGRAVVRPARTNRRGAFVDAVRRALAAPTTPAAPAGPRLTFEQVRSMIA
jgi:hypothetical protein